jgi:taurine transport system substrate-binding protein
VNTKRFSRWIVMALAVACSAAFSQAEEVTFAYQDMLVPLRTVIDSGELERTTGYEINWRQFGDGGDVIRAMSSGDVQIGEAGSSPIAAAASQGQDVRLFWILDDIADAEALVVRNGSGIRNGAGPIPRTCLRPLR